MSRRPLMYLLMTTCLLVLLLVGLATSAGPAASKNNLRLDYNQVRGSAVIHNAQAYTLNFDQQNQLITYLNAAVDGDTNAWTKTKLTYSAIEIYRFNTSELSITPLGYENNDLLFSTPSWNSGKTLRDTSSGKLKALIENAFDEV